MKHPASQLPAKGSGGFEAYRFFPGAAVAVSVIGPNFAVNRIGSDDIVNIRVSQDTDISSGSHASRGQYGRRRAKRQTLTPDSLNHKIWLLMGVVFPPF